MLCFKTKNLKQCAFPPPPALLLSFVETKIQPSVNSVNFPQAFYVFLTDVCFAHLFCVYWWAVYSKRFQLVFIINLWKLFKLFCTFSIANIPLTETIHPTPYTIVEKTHLLFNILHIFKCILMPLSTGTFFAITFLQSYLPFSRYGFSISFSTRLKHLSLFFPPFLKTTSHC